MPYTDDHLVFLPGWGYRASALETLVTFFAPFSTQLIDLPQNDLNQSISALADELPTNSTLIGWSLGGLVAIAACLQKPEKFKKLVLINSSACFSQKTDWTGITAENAEKFKKTAENDISALLAHFHRLVAFPHVSKDNLAYLKKHVAKTASLIGHLNYLLETDIRDQFHSINIPVLSLASEKDAILPAGHADFIIQGAGHAAFLTHGELISNKIKQFINEINDAKATCN